MDSANHRGTKVAGDRGTEAANGETNQMQAIVYHRYGPPEVLVLREVDKPVVGDDGVLIRVRAAAVNPYEWHFMRGEPYLARLQMGLKPKTGRLGVDVAGTVEAVGSNVTQFQPGDEVFGTCDGALAEYAVGTESSLVSKPASVTFEQAGAVGIAAFTAMQGLRDFGQVQAGQKVMIKRCGGRRGHLCRAAGQGVGGPGDRCVQHSQRRHGSIDWRRPCH